MAVEIKCDDCGKDISYGDETYCKKCIDYLQSQVNELEKENEDLRSQKNKEG